MQRVKWRDRSEYEDSYGINIAAGKSSETMDRSGESSVLVKSLKDDSRKLLDQSIIMQQESTKQLMERLKEVNKWKSTLEREIQELISVSDTLSKQGKRLQKADGCVGLAEKVNEECILTRKKRQKVPSENWRTDKVDAELETESYLIRDVGVKLKETIREFENQIISNTEAKHRLEHDWSRKKEAYEHDYKSAALTNESAESSMYKKSAANYAANMSYPDEWQRYNTNVVSASADQRSKSEQLLQKISGLLKDSSRDLKIQAERVDSALTDSIRRFVDQIQIVAATMKVKDGELKQIEKTMAELNGLKDSKSAPLKVALARMEQRNRRSGMELCNDSAHQALLREVGSLEGILQQANEKLDEASRVAKVLDDEIRNLKSKENILRYNMNLDSDILRNVRAVYPPQIQLTGYLV